MAEWSPLQTGKRGDSRSNTVGVKTFSGEIKSFEYYIACCLYVEITISF